MIVSQKLSQNRFPVVEKDTQEFAVIATEFTGVQHMEEKLRGLLGYIGGQPEKYTIFCALTVSALEDPDKVGYENVKIRMYHPVLEDILGEEESKALTDEYFAVRVKPQRVISTFCRGYNGEDIGRAYQLLISVLEENKYKVAGPPMELYWNDPKAVAPEHSLMELQWPVEVLRSKG